MSKENIEDIYPLSPMQQGMLFHSLYSPESGEYIEQLCCKLQGNLDVVAFERAWQEVIDRHPILRTSFIWEGLEEPLQVVQRIATLKIEQADWRQVPQKEQGKRLADYFLSDRSRGFDLSIAPLMRLSLIQLDADHFQFVWTHHHILVDGWSVPLLFEEVFTFYEAYSNGRSIQLEQKLPYREYIAWLQQQDQVKAEAYWRSILQDFTAPTPIVIERSVRTLAAAENDYCLEHILFPAALSNELQSISRQHKVTLNTLIQGAWALLLSRYSRERDVAFGAIVSGRPPDLIGAEQMIGLFINTLPVRVSVSPTATLLSWLNELQHQQSEQRQFEYSSLIQIQGWSDVPRDVPLFHSILVFENYPISESLNREKKSLEISDIESTSRTNYPLTLVASPGKQIGLEVAYDRRRFEPATIKRMLNHLQVIMQQFSANIEAQLSHISILTAAEQQQLLVDWNNTNDDYPADVCVHQLFEEQVAKTPAATALVLEDRQLTYQELNEKANQLAHYLRNQGVTAETLVGICMDRSFELIIGMLGILKAGGAFVPMDPHLPTARLAFICEDAKLSLLLTQKSIIENLPDTHAKKILLDEDWAAIAAESTAPVENQTSAENLAYIIYTSGSTGNPKGTLLNHQGLNNFLTAFSITLKMNAQSRMLHFASISFDASIAEIFSPLIIGAALVLARKEVIISATDLHRYLQETGVTTATFPPSMLSVMSPEKLTTLKTIISVGEACNRAIVEQWAPGRLLLNGYGPTETTIGATWGSVNNLTIETTNIPIGKPVANKQIYILDQYLNPLPAEVPGELHVGGVGLARGYLNRPDLTAEKFIPDPFSKEEGARLYKTGDLARYLLDGTLEFIGRIDFQVKIRGFRIELGEIENVLNQHPAVKSAVVVAQEHHFGEKRLVAYYIPDQKAAAPAVSDLHEFLMSRLPEYMVPSFYLKLDAFPLTTSGKVDRKALPAPEKGHFASSTAYVAPRTPTEEMLAAIWAQVLGLERVGIHDNFFELGGHSLLATQLLSRIREAFQVEFAFKYIFDSPTLADLARILENSRMAHAGLEAPAIEPVERDRELPLSFAQERLWFLDQLEPNSPFYNIPTAMRFSGTLNIMALEKSIHDIVRRHESLRTIFKSVDGKPHQVIIEDIPSLMEHIDLHDLATAEQEQKVQQLATDEALKPFNLSAGPLIRVTLVKLTENDHVILFTMHHIISDGWSVGVLMQEVAALYEAFSSGQPSPFADLPLQYADFAYWQRQWLSGKVLEAQLNYWREKLSGSPPLLELPTDRPRPAVQSFRGLTISRILPKELMQSIKQLCQEEDVTLFMALLAAFQSLMYRYTNQIDFNIGTPIANRNRLETESLIGFFVNTLVLRSDLSGNPNFKQLLERVRETALAAYAHQDTPFEMLVETLQPGRDLSHTPLFQVMFVLQNAPMQVYALPGLTLKSIESESGSAKFDLSLIVMESAAGLVTSYEFNTDLFEQATIERMMDHFQYLLQAIVQDPEQPISSLPLMTEQEKQIMLHDWNDTRTDFPIDSSMHQWFESLAQNDPDAVAVIYNDQKLSYAELNARANQLARYLLKLNIAPENLIGICMERSLEMVVSILGALKAGAAFIPLDPAYPEDRLSFMITDSSIPILLTQQSLVQQVPAHQAKIICVDAEWQTISQEKSENLNLLIDPTNLAYVIYTSGSTGKPKGTMLQHRGWCNLGKAQQKAFGVGKGNRVLQFSSLSFDASVWEIVMALLSGATLTLTDRDALATGQGLLEVLAQQQINTVTLPPSVLAVIPEAELPALSTIITAGEACTADLVSRWSNGRHFFNAYGPTETTVCASMFLVPDGYQQNPPIGLPIANFQLYVLDEYSQPVAIGVPGELHIGGMGLARGYLKRPDLTAEKFIPDPFGGTAGARLYRSGDLVRYRPDGNIEFMGRIDHQVKVRGFRIELGEIEVVLSDHPKIRDVAVIVREDVPGDRRIVAYMITQPGTELTVGELRNFLRERLPEYMVPSGFMTLTEFPLTPNGKVDRRALPKPDQTRPELEREYVAPRNETEEKLAQICADLLQVEKVGVYDNFFELGGHSLLATQFISRVRTAFNVELPLRSLFEKPTIEGLAAAIEEAKLISVAQPQAPAIERVSRDAHRMKRSELG